MIEFKQREDNQIERDGQITESMDRQTVKMICFLIADLKQKKKNK